MNTTPLVKASGLTKDYRGNRALDQLSFSIGPGEVLGLLGPNGAGKTTAIHIVLGLLKPSAGDIQVFGISPFANHHRIAPRMNFSSAYTNMPLNLSVLENMKTFARLYGIRDADAMIMQRLEQFEITGLTHAVTGSLSSGEQTRLNLAKALLNDPDLLILDEPTASLDPDISDKVRTILMEIRDKRDMGILYTSHNMLEVEQVCDRILFLHRGATMITGTAEDIRRHFASRSLEEAFIKMARSGDLSLSTHKEGQPS